MLDEIILADKEKPLLNSTNMAAMTKDAHHLYFVERVVEIIITAVARESQLRGGLEAVGLHLLERSGGMPCAKCLKLRSLK